MNGMFRYDNKFFMLLGKLTDMVILNIVFLITCIPLFTIGTAFVAMYDVTMRMVKNEESYIIRSYLKSFKSNFKKSTPIWLVIAAIGGVLIFDLQIVNQQDSYMWYLLRSLLLSLLLMEWIMVAYMAPLQAKFELTYKQLIKNSLIMAMKHMLTTISIVVMNSVLLLLLFSDESILFYVINVYVLIGFAFCAYINSMLITRVFDKYLEEEQDNGEVI